MKTVRAADLFCGAGGTSTGLYKAADLLGKKVELLAVNHWPVAIATHSSNHKLASHLCHGLDGVDPRKIIKGGRLDLLVASPECTHHSNARGGRPMNDQSRASAWHVIRWLEALDVRGLIVENVREFQNWGPLGRDGRPIKSRKGELFQAWLGAIRALGYNVDHKVLNAADYGDPTTRQRLFVLAKKGRKTIVWPEPTHARDSGQDLFGARKPWRAAREIIDWSDSGTSIFNRKKSLSPNTIRRIQAGLRKFSGLDVELQPIIVKLYGTSDGASIDAPLPTVTGGGQHLAVATPAPFILPKEGIRRGNLPRSVEQPAQTVVPHHGLGYFVQPFLLGQQSGGEPRTTDAPAPTVATRGAIAKVEPFLTAHFGERAGQEPRVHSVDEPAPTVTRRGAGDLAVPFLLDANHGIKNPDESQERRAQSVDEPIGVVTGSRGKAIATPFVVGAGGPSFAGEPKSLEEPLGTVVAKNSRAFIVPQFSEQGPRSVERPVPTITTTSRGIGVVTACLVKYYGTGDASSVDKPMGTVTGRPHHALLVTFTNGEKKILDIRFRMLKTRELARAQSFPDDYVFTGNTEQVVKQIGNAVPVGVSTALCLVMI